MDVTGVKGPYAASDLVAWARSQLEIARSILDNPGGGLLFATQAMSPGTRVGAPANHYSLLRTIQAIFGLDCLAQSCKAAAIRALLSP